MHLYHAYYSLCLPIDSPIAYNGLLRGAEQRSVPMRNEVTDALSTLLYADIGLYSSTPDEQQEFIQGFIVERFGGKIEFE